MEYEAGMTELRMNVKSMLAGLQNLNNKVGELDALLHKERSNTAQLLQEIVLLKTELTGMKAKLYEAGVR